MDNLPTFASSRHSLGVSSNNKPPISSENDRVQFEWVYLLPHKDVARKKEREREREVRDVGGKMPKATGRIMLWCFARAIINLNEQRLTKTTSPLILVHKIWAKLKRGLLVSMEKKDSSTILMEWSQERENSMLCFSNCRSQPPLMDHKINFSVFFMKE